jgi:hypothetical protein
VKTSATRLTFSRLPTTFEGLVKFHPPRPIHDATGYENTAEIVDVLAVAGPRLNADQADYLELLATLIERYDAENAEKLPVSSGLDLLKYLVAEHDLGGDGLALLVVRSADEDVGHGLTIHLLFLHVGHRAATADHGLLGGQFRDGVRGELERFVAVEEEMFAQGFLLLGVGLAGQRLTQGAELGERRHLARVKRAGVEEDVAEAAAWMRRLAEEPELRQTLARKGQEAIRAQQQAARRGEAFRHLERFWEQWRYRREQGEA